MDLKTEAQLTQELSELWRMLGAERAGFSRIIAEKDREIERLQTNIDVMKRALRWSEWEEDGDG